MASYLERLQAPQSRNLILVMKTCSVHAGYILSMHRKSQSLGEMRKDKNEFEEAGRGPSDPDDLFIHQQEAVAASRSSVTETRRSKNLQ